MTKITKSSGKQQEKKPAKELLENLNFCVFDLETTGGNHQSDKIIEIGIVRIENLKIIKTKNYLINPEIKIPDFIQKLTSIKEEDVKDSPKIEEIIHEILVLMEDSILVAHNTSFDVPFFNSVLTRLNLPELTNKSLCTNLMTKYLVPHLLNTNLNYTCKLFGVSHKKAHRALDDANATAQLLMKFLKIFIQKNITKINHLYYPKNRYELDRENFKGKNNKEEFLKTFKKTNCPLLVTMKIESGVISYGLPLKSYEDGLENILNYLEKNSPKVISIRLFGTFEEALITFTHFYPKLAPATKSEVLTVLDKNYLDKKNSLATNRPNYSIDEGVVGTEKFDFLLVNHLIRDQFVIYPLVSLNQRSQLLFRYPGHAKKLLQFLRSKSNRIQGQKQKKTHLPGKLREFMSLYFKQLKDKNESVVYISRSVVLNKNLSDEIEIIISDFIKNNPSNLKYPKEYL